MQLTEPRRDGAAGMIPVPAERPGLQRYSLFVKREASEFRNEIRFTRPASRDSMATRACGTCQPIPLHLLTHFMTSVSVARVQKMTSVVERQWCS